MKCISCETEINPKWKHAIESNICPFCGKSIIEEKAKELLTSLSTIMECLNSYPEHLRDWMLSNYSFIQTSDENLINYVPEEVLLKKYSELGGKVSVPNATTNKKYKVEVASADGKVSEVEVEKLKSDEDTSKFFERAEAVKKNGNDNIVEKTQHLKKLAKQLKSNKVTEIHDESLDVSEMDGMGEEINKATLDSILQEDMAQYNTKDNDLEEEDLPPAVLAMMANSKSGTGNMKDLALLQKLQQRRKNSLSNFESGESRGSGGFSRGG